MSAAEARKAYPAVTQQRAAEISAALGAEMVQYTNVAMGQALASGTGALMMAPDGTAKAVNVLMEWTPEQCAQMQTLQEAKRQMVEQCRQLLEPVYDGGPGHLAALAWERDAARAELQAARVERDAARRDVARAEMMMRAADRGWDEERATNERLRAELAALHDILGTRPVRTDSKPSPMPDFTRDFTGDRRRLGGPQ